MTVEQIIPLVLLLVLPLPCLAQRKHPDNCLSVAASALGDWQPVSTAPRDGTPIEMLETYGYAPWYGLFKYVKPAQYTMAGWLQLNRGDGHNYVMEDSCLFWRPYRGDVKNYVDPTNGAQNTVAYECVYLHMRYNKRRDACEPQ